MTGDTGSTSLWAESIPAAVAAGGRESHVLEVLTVVEQSLERWKTNQRHTRDLIMDTWMLKYKTIAFYTLVFILYIYIAIEVIYEL